METLDLGVLIDVVYPYTHGGAEKRVALLSREMVRRGHEVTVYAMHWWPGPAKMDLDGVHYVAVTGSRALYADKQRRSLDQPFAYGLHAAGHVLIADHDLVDCNQFPFVHLPPAKLAAMVRRKPMAITWHEVWRRYWFSYAPFPASMIGAALEDLAPRASPLNIAVSQHTAARLHEAGVRPSQVSVVPNAIDLARIKAVPPREEPTDIIFTGRLIAHKRLDRLLAACARLNRTLDKDLRLTIVGAGPEEQRLRSLARGLGLAEHMEFTGPLQDEDQLLATMKSARLFVSASEREGFGIAALEAMACGLPVVTVDHPMNALAGELVVDGHNGIVVRDATARSLSSALGALLADEPLRRRLAQNAHATAQDYDAPAIAARLEAAYRTVLDGHTAPAPATSVPHQDRMPLRAR